MDVEREWAVILEAAAAPARIGTAEERVVLLKTALGLGESITPDSAGCSITLTVGGGYVTPAASSALALDLDLAQYADNDGPCVAACRDGDRHSIVIMSEEQAYPGFTTAARRHGVRSSLSLPLPSRPSAALNLYARSPNAFTAEKAQATAALLARCVVQFLPAAPPASRATSAVSEADMRDAVRSRALVQRATAALAERDAITQTDAFSRMATRSRTEQGSIFRIAADIIDDQEKRGDDR